MLNDGIELQSTMDEQEIISMVKNLGISTVQTLMSTDDSPWFTFKISDVKFMKFVKEGN